MKLNLKGEDFAPVERNVPDSWCGGAFDPRANSSIRCFDFGSDIILLMVN